MQVDDISSQYSYCLPDDDDDDLDGGGGDDDPDADIFAACFRPLVYKLCQVKVWLANHLLII
jgi:hypothetical protein